MIDKEQGSYTVYPDGRSEDDQPKWRQDFPIDWAQDTYIARRDFTKFLVLISLAFTTGQLWILVQQFLKTKETAATAIKIADLNQLQIGQSLVFSYPLPPDRCVLTRLEANKYVAYSQLCTHLSCAVVPQPEQHRLFCPCHEGVFDITSGRPIAGPPRRALPQVKLEMRNDGIYAIGTLQI